MTEAVVLPVAYNPVIAVPSLRRTRAVASVTNPPLVPRSPG
jgi:hypothetical protein